MQSQVVQQGSGEGLGGFGAEPGQVQQGSGEGLGGFGAEPGQVQQGSGEGLGGFGAEPGQVQQGSGEGLVQSQARFNRVPEKVPEKVWEALVQSQVKFNRVPEKVLGSLGAKPSQVLNGFCREGCREGPGKGFGNLRCRARSGSTDSIGSIGFPALGFAARLRKICKNKTLRLLGIPPKFILFLIGLFKVHTHTDTYIYIYIYIYINIHWDIKLFSL